MYYYIIYTENLQNALIYGLNARLRYGKINGDVIMIKE